MVPKDKNLKSNSNEVSSTSKVADDLVEGKSIELNGDKSARDLFGSSFGEEIATLLKVLEERGVTEFTLERESTKISLKRGYSGEQNFVNNPRFNLPGYLQNYQNNAHPGYLHNSLPNSGYDNSQNSSFNTNDFSNSQLSNLNVNPLGEIKHSVIAKNKAFIEITSPMVGTFYRRPAVDAEPYVKVGDTVKKGDLLCIIEAMKLMNEIECEVSGKIVEVCMDDTQMVEFGEVIFRIEPNI